MNYIRFVGCRTHLVVAKGSARKTINSLKHSNAVWPPRSLEGHHSFDIQTKLEKPHKISQILLGYLHSSENQRSRHRTSNGVDVI